MPRFAVSFIPPGHSPFFRLGTSILGYDIRSERMPPPDNFIRTRLPNFDIQSTEKPGISGFHSTLIGAYDCQSEDFDRIQHEIQAILSGFARETVFRLQADATFVDFWGADRNIVILKYVPSISVAILHTALLTQLISFASGSKFHPVANPTAFSATEIKRITRYYHPYVLDGFIPHFTLLDPYTDSDQDTLTAALHNLFDRFKQLELDSICLMRQDAEGEQWKLAREFMLADYMS